MLDRFLPIPQRNPVFILWLTVCLTMIVWSATFVMIFSRELRFEHARFNDMMHLKAGMLSDNIQAIRRWIGGHGGIYVEAGNGVVPNPFLSGVTERDIRTPSNRQLTLFNSPAFLRSVFEEFEAANGTRVRLISQNPVNPVNKPNEWESRGLDRLYSGAPTFAEAKEIDGRSSYRFLQPMKLQDKCITCHDRNNPSEVGKMIGAISIDLDVTKDEATHDDMLFFLLLSHISVWAVGMAGLAAGAMGWRDMLSRLKKMAASDPLTGLPNRGALMSSLDTEFDRALRYREDLSVMMLDIDHFKKVNDTYGHQAGDDVLRSVAVIVEAHLRISDVVGRYGGEEIMVVCPHTHRKGAVAIAERIRKAIAEAEIETAAGEISVTVSIGVADLQLNPSNMTVAGMIESADSAMYKAKEAGRNRVRTATRSRSDTSAPASLVVSPVA